MINFIITPETIRVLMTLDGHYYALEVSKNVCKKVVAQLYLRWVITIRQSHHFPLQDATNIYNVINNNLTT